MARELPRTIDSLTPPIQREVDSIDYEVIVVDNGSQPPVPIAEEPVKVLRAPAPRPSPAAAVNYGIQASRAPLVGVMIDGARLASPGVIAGALRASRLHARPVIATLGFHLGPNRQQESVPRGYDEQAEDELLERSGWRENGYRLFDISVPAASSARGWFMPIFESNALFMPRVMWQELGGYDERFVSPGGGLVNLDTYERACNLPGAQLITLLGEGTFHQVHGGVSTNSPDPPVQAFHDEYRRLRNRSFEPPQVASLYLGRVSPPVLRSVRDAADIALAEAYRDQLT